ncbi:CsbD family protein [Limobrevibacterium gyesilva]
MRRLIAVSGHGARRRASQFAPSLFGRTKEHRQNISRICDGPVSTGLGFVPDGRGYGIGDNALSDNHLEQSGEQPWPKSGLEEAAKPRSRRQRRNLPRSPRRSSARSQRVRNRQTRKVPGNMDKDRIIGAGKQVLGAVKEAVGKAIGDTKLQVDGKVETVEGKLQNTAGSMKDTVKDALKD